MSKRALPDQETLQNLLSYDESTGVLRWRPRPPIMFKNTKHRSPDEQSVAWNAQYAGKPALNSPNEKGYLTGTLMGKKCFAHRVIWKIKTGLDPIEIDHINGIRDDNRFINLRNANRSENTKNRRMNKNNTSGVTGVHWSGHAMRWVAAIRVDGRHITLGKYKEKEDAVAVRKMAERKYGFYRNHGKPMPTTKEGLLE